MCLFIREKKPRIAKKDITVLKYVKLRDNDIITPCQNTIIPVNEVMTAYPNKENIEFYSKDLLDNNIYYLNGGAIHAKLIKNSISYLTIYEARKAIIPAGTEYWVSICGNEIAARSMIITDINWENGDNKISENLFEEILENAPKVNGVRIGDYLLENGEYARPRKGLSEDKVVGIVAGFHKGEPLIAALTFFNCAYNKMLINSKFGEYYNTEKDVIKEFNGRSITKKYRDGKTNNRFESFNACINYRKDKNEEWYFAAAGEVATMINNCIYLNAAHQITGLGFSIGDELYSSCSEFNHVYSWGCHLNILYEIGACCTWNRKNNELRTVPFLDLKNFLGTKNNRISLIKWIKRYIIKR